MLLEGNYDSSGGLNALENRNRRHDYVASRMVHFPIVIDRSGGLGAVRRSDSQIEELREFRVIGKMP